MEYEAYKKSKLTKREQNMFRKSACFGLEYCKDALFCGQYGIPLLKSYTDSIPGPFCTFSEMASSYHPDCCVTSFDYDYVIDRLWDNPEKYVDNISHYKCMAESDFSLMVNHPLCVQIANTYRSHAVAYYMQEHGIPILPSMSWSTTRSFDFCFDGHSKGGVVLVSTIGTLRDERSNMFFRLGFFEMLKRIAPDAVIIYGNINDELQSWLPKQLDVHFYKHERYNRARNHGK